MAEPPSKIARMTPPEASGDDKGGGSYNKFAEKMMVRYFI